MSHLLWIIAHKSVKIHEWTTKLRKVSAEPLGSNRAVRFESESQTIGFCRGVGEGSIQNATVVGHRNRSGRIPSFINLFFLHNLIKIQNWCFNSFSLHSRDRLCFRCWRNETRGWWLTGCYFEGTKCSWHCSDNYWGNWAIRWHWIRSQLHRMNL